MSNSSGFNPGTDPFARFWTDMAARMAPPSTDSSFSQAPWVPNEQMLKQMRQMFFDAWEKNCQEFMGSEQFLGAMKQSMDGSLAFREQMNEFMLKSLEQSPLTTKTDTEAIGAAIRSLEERVVGEVERLSSRIETLERQNKSSGSKGGGA